MITLNKTYTLGAKPDPQTAEKVWNYCNILPGWEDIIRRLLIDLDKPEMEWSNHITQVKEKFGTLRFYVGYASDAVFDRIRDAERESEITCQICGKPGVLRSSGWFTTRCDEHSEGYPPYDEDEGAPPKPITFSITFPSSTEPVF